MPDITAQNVKEVNFDTLRTLIYKVYDKDVPVIGIEDEPNLKELEMLMSFFANTYSYLTELWSIKRVQTFLPQDAQSQPKETPGRRLGSFRPPC